MRTLLGGVRLTFSQQVAPVISSVTTKLSAKKGGGGLSEMVDSTRMPPFSCDHVTVEKVIKMIHTTATTLAKSVLLAQRLSFFRNTGSTNVKLNTATANDPNNPATFSPGRRCPVNDVYAISTYTGQCHKYHE